MATPHYNHLSLILRQKKNCNAPVMKQSTQIRIENILGTESWAGRNHRPIASDMKYMTVESRMNLMVLILPSILLFVLL